MAESLDPYKSVVDYDREERRSALRDAVDDEHPMRPRLADEEANPFLEDGHPNTDCPPWCTRDEYHDGECSPPPEPPYDTVEERRGLR